MLGNKVSAGRGAAPTNTRVALFAIGLLLAVFFMTSSRYDRENAAPANTYTSSSRKERMEVVQGVEQQPNGSKKEQQSPSEVVRELDEDEVVVTTTNGYTADDDNDDDDDDVDEDYDDYVFEDDKQSTATVTTTTTTTKVVADTKEAVDGDYEEQPSDYDYDYDYVSEGDDDDATGVVHTTRSDGMDQCGPFLIGIGVQKGGTTELFFYLRHSLREKFNFPDTKELHFFDKGFVMHDNIEDRVNDYYKRWNSTWKSMSKTELGGGWVPCMSPAGVRYIPASSVGKPWVEITPAYIYDPSIAGRINSMIPGGKFVVLLRNPTKRAMSHINMGFRKENFGRIAKALKETDPVKLTKLMIPRAISLLKDCTAQYPTITAGQALLKCYNGDLRPKKGNPFQDDIVALIWRGIYVEQLRFWFKHYTPARITVFSSEEFYSDIPRHLEILTKWLNIDTSEFTTGIPFKPRNEPKQFPYQVLPETVPDVVQALDDLYEPYNDMLYDFLTDRGYFEVVEQFKKYF